jgi:hypothetical protein
MLDQWQLHDFDPILSDFSTGWTAKDLVGLQVAPETKTLTLAGRYMVFDRSDWLIFPDLRAMGTVANEIQGAKWSTTPYSVREHSLQVPVFDEEREELGGAGSFPVDFSLDQSAVDLATRSIRLGHEKVVADTYRLAANYPVGNTATLATADQWDNYASAASEPVADIEAALRAIYVSSGRAANTIVMPWLVWSYLRNHPKLVDRFKSFQLTAPEAFAELTGFSGNLIIAESQYNTADNIDATESIADFWGKDVWIGVVDDTPGQRTKTFGKTFVYPYNDSVTMPVDRWREEPRKADLVRTSFRYDVVITSNVAGYLYKTVIA